MKLYTKHAMSVGQEIATFTEIEGNKLLPFTVMIHCYVFFNIATLYITSANYEEQFTYLFLSTLTKCAPTLMLILFVYLYGYIDYDHGVYNIKIATALLLSSIADGLMNLDFFEAGILVFGFAHVFYIWAFGWYPLRPLALICLALVTSTYLYFIQDYIQDNFLMHAIPVYAILLMVLCWRGLARIHRFKDNHFYIFKWTTGIGTILFALSDGCIAIDRFCVPIPFRTPIVMALYYTAQMCIMLSVHRCSKYIKVGRSSLRQHSFPRQSLRQRSPDDSQAHTQESSTVPASEGSGGNFITYSRAYMRYPTPVVLVRPDFERKEPVVHRAV